MRRQMNKRRRFDALRHKMKGFDDFGQKSAIVAGKPIGQSGGR